MDASIVLIVLIALVIDLVLGELPPSVHPVVLMGKFIDFSKNFKDKHPSLDTRLYGTASAILIIAVFTTLFTLAIYLTNFNAPIFILVSSILLSTTFAVKVLLDSAEKMRKYLDEDLDLARRSVSYLVSRDTSELSVEEVVSATIETLTENIADSVVSPLFYAFIFGVPGAVAYRAVNTMDAMLGYKDPETLKIGWFPAKLDDFLNYIPARLTGILVTLAALLMGLNWRNAYSIMMRDARKTPSPNSGYPMAAAAGALEVKLKKIGCYELGDDLKPLDSGKINEALVLTKITLLLFVLLSVTVFGIFLAIF
jgi:adenosylcobinamide-phosphate synthase